MIAADVLPPECDEAARKCNVRRKIKSQKERACESYRNAEGMDNGALVTRLARVACVSIGHASKEARTRTSSRCIAATRRTSTLLVYGNQKK
jgi:hypothetical protein